LACFLWRGLILRRGAPHLTRRGKAHAALPTQELTLRSWLRLRRVKISACAKTRTGSLQRVYERNRPFAARQRPGLDLALDSGLARLGAAAQEEALAPVQITNSDFLARTKMHGPNSINPEGWQTVAGGCSGQRGNDHRARRPPGGRTPEGCQRKGWSCASLSEPVFA